MALEKPMFQDYKFHAESKCVYSSSIPNKDVPNRYDISAKKFLNESTASFTYKVNNLVSEECKNYLN